MMRVFMGLAALAIGPALADAQSAPENSGASLPSVAEVRADTENWRAVDPENLIVFETSKGQVLIEVLPEVAPAHAEQFVAIVRSGDYDGTFFHRVIDGFMAQGGDIQAVKGRDSGRDNIPGEFTFRRNPAEMPLDPIGLRDAATNGYYKGFPMRTQAFWLAEMSKDGFVESHIPHCPGVVSTARTDDPNSANSQFFLMRDTAAHLDKQYTAWGRIVSGQDVVLALKIGEPPANPDVLRSARMAADLPEAQRPSVWVQRTDGPDFAETLASHAEADDWNVCNFPAVPTVVSTVVSSG
ncbi:MAG: peptidylprolyl isomerase [Pseudomonadota bacterium]